MNRYWPTIVMLIAISLGCAGCKERRAKKTVPKEDVEEIAKVFTAASELGQAIARSKKKPVRKVVEEPADRPIDVESAKYLGWRAKADVPKLLELVQHDNPAVRYQALFKLARFNPPPSTGLPVAISALKDPRSRVRLAAAQLIAKYESNAKSAVPALMEALKDSEFLVVMHAADAILATGALPDKTLPVLIALLDDENCHQKGPVMKLIGTFGPKASAVIPRLTPHLSKLFTGRWAAEALAQVGGYQVLIEKANQSTSMARQHAIHGLGYVRPTPSAVVETLIKFSKSTDRQTRQNVAESLGLVRPTTEPVVATLGRMTRDRDMFVQRLAAESLGTIEPKLESAVQHLLKASSSPNKRVKEAVVESLAQFKSAGTSRILVAINMLNGKMFDQMSAEDVLEKDPKVALKIVKDILADRKRPHELRIKATRALAIRELLKFDDARIKKQLRTIIENRSEHIDLRVVAAAAYHSNYFEEHPLGYATILEGIRTAKDPTVKVFAVDRGGRVKYSKDPELIKRTVAALTDQLQNSNDSVVSTSCKSLEYVSEHAGSAIVPLCSVISRGNPTNWSAAAKALAKIDTTGEKSVPVMLAAVNRCLADRRSLRHLSDFLDPMGRIIERVRLSGGDNPQYKFDLQPIIQAAIRVIRRGDSSSPGDAAGLLGNIGPAAAVAVPDIIPLVDAKSRSGHDLAIWALGQIGPKAAAAAPRLMPMVRDPTHESHQYALSAAAAIGVPAETMLPYLIRALENEKTASAAVGAIASYGPAAKPAIPALVKLFNKGDRKTRVAVLQATKSLGPAAIDLLPLLREILRGNGLGERVPALETLAVLKEKAKPALPEVKLLMLHPNLYKTYRIAAAKAYVNIIGDDDQQLKLLVRALNINEYEYIEFVAGLGPRSLKLLPDLRKELTNSEYAFRINSVITIGKLGPKAAAAIPDVKKMILNQKEDNDMRACAAVALMDLVGDDPEKLTTVVAALDTKDEDFLKRFHALGKTTLTVLRAALKDKEPQVRKQALVELGSVLPAAEARKLQLQLLVSQDETLRLQAALVLDAVGGYRRRVVPVLIDSLLKVDKRQRYRVANSLSSAGPAAALRLALVVADEKAEPARRERAAEILAGSYYRRVGLSDLRPAMKSKHEAVRINTAIAIASSDAIDAETEAEVVSILLTAVKSKDDEIRGRAARKLAYAKTERKAVKAALLAMLNDSHSHVRYAAAESLQSQEISDADIPMLRKLLKEKHGPETVLSVFGRSEHPSKKGLSLLIELLESSDENIAQLSANTMRYWDDAAVKSVAASLLKPKRSVRARVLALSVLQQLESLNDHTLKNVAALQKDKHEDVARWAAVVIATHGRVDQNTRPLLLAAAIHGDWRLSNPARWQLAKLGKRSAVLLPDVKNLLRDPAAKIRYAAAQVYPIVAKDSKQPAAPLFAALSNEERSRYQHSIVQQIALLGSAALPELKAKLADQDIENVTLALTVIESMKENAKPLEGDIRKLLKHSDRDVVLHAAIALCDVNPQSDDALPILLAAAKRTNVVDGDGADNEQFFRILHALERLGPEKSGALLPKLLPLLDESRRNRRVIRFIGKMQAAGQPALDKLMSTVETARSSYLEASALTALGPNAAAVAPRLLKLLPNENRMLHAARILAAMGDAGKPAIPILTKLADDEYLQLDAVAALGTFSKQGTTVAPILVKHLRQPNNEYVIDAALQALSGMGETARSSNDAVLGILNDPKSESREVAADTLAALKSDSEKTVPALITVMSLTKSNSLQSRCANALGAFGTQAEAAVEPLMELLKSNATQAAAAGALGRIGPGAQAAVSPLIPLLNSDRSETVQAAATALGEFGAAAKPAVPQLVKLLKSRSRSLRIVAGHALWKIDPAAAEKARAPQPKTKQKGGSSR